MLRRPFAVLASMLFALSASAAPNTPASQTALSAKEIADKNVTARGGLEAWRSVQALSMSGKMGIGGNQRGQATPPPAVNPKAHGVVVPQRPVEEVQAPFLMELKRPGKSRLELEFRGDKAVQIYDGSNGWKLRPYLNRREVEAYTSDEAKAASTQSELDGPLVDYSAKGTQIEFVGTDRVEGRDTYKLKLTTKSGYSNHIWIDAQTFLEVKVEGLPRRMDGVYHPVEVYYRDYRNVNGLQIPFVIETKVLPVTPSNVPSTTPRRIEQPIPAEKTVFDKIVVNPKLDDSLFTKQSLVEVAAAKPAPPKPAAAPK